jgi:hypothetical protein
MMKLLRCNKCLDVFSIHYDVRECSCGETSGKYFEDGLHAIYKGDCTPLGFANGSFRQAIHNQPEKGWGEDFTAFVIQKECDTFKKVDKLI